MKKMTEAAMRNADGGKVYKVYVSGNGPWGRFSNTCVYAGYFIGAQRTALNIKNSYAALGYSAWIK